MRSLVGIVAISLSLFSLSTYAAHAKSCGGLDRVAQWIQKGRELHQSSFKSGSKAWDRQWSDWQAGITRDLEMSSQQRDAFVIVKSIKRKLDADAADLQRQLGKTEQLAQGAKELEAKISQLFQIENRAAKNLEILKKSNPAVYENFLAWQKVVAEQGLPGMRKIKGYEDEFIAQFNCRSSRLNNKYRVLYNVDSNGKIKVLKVIDPHDDYL